MTAPLKPTATNALTASANGSATILNDLVSRMNAQTGGAMQDEQKAAFSKWLERHASGATAADGVKPALAQANRDANASNKAASSNTRHADAEPKQPTRAKGNPGSHKAEQSGNKQANAAAKPTHKDSASAASSKAPAKATDKADDTTVAKDSDEVNFVTQMGEGTAIVRELQPPADVQRGDPSSMMAWLASLTQSDAQLAQAQSDAQKPGASSLGKSEGRDDTSSNVAALQSLLKGLGDKTPSTASLAAGDTALPGAKSDRSDKDASNQGGLDISAWQRSSTVAQFADALSLQSSSAGATAIGKGQGADSFADQMAALTAGQGAQGAQLARGQGFELAGTGRHVNDKLDTPVQSPQFADALAEQVSVYVRSAKDEGPMTAELHLNPAEMGPINIKIELNGQNAQVDFAATSLETRQAIEASLPALSASLDQVGLSLTGGGVSSQGSEQGFAQSQSNGSNDGSFGLRRARDGGAADDDMIGRTVSIPRPGQKGGLDLYA